MCRLFVTVFARGGVCRCLDVDNSIESTVDLWIITLAESAVSEALRSGFAAWGGGTPKPSWKSQEAVSRQADSGASLLG